MKGRIERELCEYAELQRDAECDAKPKPLGIVGGIILALCFSAYVFCIVQGYIYVTGWVR